MSDNTRIKININTGEVEFEGSEDFVVNQLSNLSNILNIVSGVLTSAQQNVRGAEKPKELPQDAGDVNEVSKYDVFPDNFGEWFNRFPSKIQQTEQMLVAGYFHQKNSPENIFKTSQANKLLIEQGIKVTNPADSMRSLQEVKRVFVVKKEGKLSLFRVSKDGEAHLSGLLNQRVD
ncbi:hypothetical protein ACFLV1_00070 [Chloroflexota bacterium]